MKNTIALILITLIAPISAQDIFTNEFEQNIAIRSSQFEIVDPHLSVLLLGFLCQDITSEVNSQIQTSLTTDGDNDGFLDTNLITQFSTDQPAYLTSRALTVDFIDGSCPDPLHSDACAINLFQQTDITTNFDETAACLEPVAGSTSGYTPAPNVSIAPCYSTAPVSTTINLAGVDVTLQDYQQGARYDGDLNLDNGLRRGFISETDAGNIVFPPNVPVVGGLTLASVLIGGSGNCSTGDDRDLFTDGVTNGWWFYFNTSSELVELQ